MPERLRGDRREEMEAAVLAYLRQHGPQPLSEIRSALDAVMSTCYVQRTVAELVAAGRLATRNELFYRPENGRGSPRPFPYKATVYEAVEAKARRRMAAPRPKRVEAKPTATGPQDDAPPKPESDRLTTDGSPEGRRQDLRERVLALLAERGPCPLSEIRLAVAPFASEASVDRVVRELAAEGKLATRAAKLTSEVRHGDRTQRLRYRATLFGLAGPGGRIVGDRPDAAEDEGPAVQQPKLRPEVDEGLWAILETLGRERRRQGLGVKAAAELAGVSPQYLVDLELGRVANPTVATLRAWAGALGMRLVLGVEPADGEG